MVGPVKAHQRDDVEDRAAVYRKWRRTLTFYGAVSDIDQIEWRSDVPVAVFELTRTDGQGDPGPSYLNAILERFKRDKQDVRAVTVGNALGVTAWIVLFRCDVGKFWVYNLTDCRGWWSLTADGYAEWLQTLCPRRVPEMRGTI